MQCLNISMMSKTLTRYKQVPFSIVILPSSETAQASVKTIKQLLRNVLDYEPVYSVHSVPSGGASLRVEYNTHEDKVLVEFFNALHPYNTSPTPPSYIAYTRDIA